MKKFLFKTSALAGEEIVDAKYIIVKLVDLARGKEIHMGLHLNEEPMEGNDVNDQPTPTTKLPEARAYAQLLSNYLIKHPS